MAWKELTPEEAKAHPAYGVKGWMLAIALIVLLSTLYNIASVIGDFSGLRPFSTWPVIAQAFFVIGSALSLAFAIAVFAKSALARTLVVASLVVMIAGVGAVLAGAYDPFAIVDLSSMSPEERAGVEMMRSPEAQALIQSVTILVWLVVLWYFYTRQRPNVTLMHRDKDLAG